jgi:hypothetical protein
MAIYEVNNWENSVPIAFTDSDELPVPHEGKMWGDFVHAAES